MTKYYQVENMSILVPGPIEPLKNFIKAIFPPDCFIAPIGTIQPCGD